MFLSELDSILEKSYSDLKKVLEPILIMIKLENKKISLKSYNEHFTRDIYTGDAFDDVKTLNDMFCLNDDILKVEKQYLDILFGHYKQIHSIWKLGEFIKYHTMAYFALMFDKKTYKVLMRIYVRDFFETYPFDYEYYLIKGEDLLEFSKKCKYNVNKELHRQYSGILFAIKYTIKKTKWYILRNNHRYLLNNPSNIQDLNYFDNIYKKGISTKKETIKLLNDLKQSEFIPKYKCGESHVGCNHEIIFFKLS